MPFIFRLSDYTILRTLAEQPSMPAPQAAKLIADLEQSFNKKLGRAIAFPDDSHDPVVRYYADIWIGVATRVQSRLHQTIQT